MPLRPTNCIHLMGQQKAERDKEKKVGHCCSIVQIVQLELAGARYGHQSTQSAMPLND